MGNSALVFIGPMGHGKSSTCNKLSESNFFTVGQDTVSVTHSLNFKKGGSLTLVDCPGFGDLENEKFFLESFLSKKSDILNLTPISAFILVIKFNINESPDFLQAAKNFVKCFGSSGIKSLVILCIQSNVSRRYSDDEFENIFKTSDGYRFLKNKNNGKIIEYCLWENLNTEYPNQRKKFETCVERVPKFVELQMKYAIDMIENQLKTKRKNRNKKCSIL